MYSPLYRQEQERKRPGIQLSRQTLSNWLVRCAEEHLAPVYEELHRQLLREDIIHADETKVHILKESGENAQSDTFMWLYRSGKYAKLPIVLYKYQPSRGGQKREPPHRSPSCVRPLNIWRDSGRIWRAIYRMVGSRLVIIDPNAILSRLWWDARISCLPILQVVRNLVRKYIVS